MFVMAWPMWCDGRRAGSVSLSFCHHLSHASRTVSPLPPCDGWWQTWGASQLARGFTLHPCLSPWCSIVLLSHLEIILYSDKKECWHPHENTLDSFSTYFVFWYSFKMMSLRCSGRHAFICWNNIRCDPYENTRSQYLMGNDTFGCTMNVSKPRKPLPPLSSAVHTVNRYHHQPGSGVWDVLRRSSPEPLQQRGGQEVTYCTLIGKQIHC